MFEQLVEEYTSLDQIALDAVIAEAELARRAADARMAAAVAVTDARGEFRDDGHRTIRSYLKTTLNCSGAAATKIRKRAELVNHCAEAGELLLCGRMGVEQADQLARAQSHRVAGERFAEFAPLLLAHAEQRTHRDFGVIVRHFIDRADPDGSFDTQAFHENMRNATVSDDAGSISMHASGGSALATAEMVAVFQQAVEAEVQRDFEARRTEHGDDALAHPMPRTREQRAFDALHRIFVDSVSVPHNAKRPDPLVTVLVDHVTFGTALAKHGLTDTADLYDIGSDAFSTLETDLTKHVSRTSTGTSVHPDAVLQAALTGRVRRAVVDADGVTIDLGRSSRLFTGKSRDAAQLLASTCNHRGCDIPATLCDVDHRQPWSAGGSTDQRNAMALCGPHDRWKHRAQITTRRSRDGHTYLIRHDGTPILPIGATEPEWADHASGQ